MNPYVKSEVGSLSYSREESAVNEALLAYMGREDEIRQLLPPLPQIIPFPPRYGYPTRAIGITDVIDMGRSRYTQTHGADYSGSYGTYSGSWRPGLGMA